MAGNIYKEYERLYLQQAELCEEGAVAWVRAAFADFSRRYLKILRSVAVNRRTSSQASGTRNVNLLTRCAQEEMDAARDFAQRQLAATLANGFEAIANLPMPFSANEPTVSGTSNQAANAEQEADNPDNDSMSVKSEDSSECECGCESVNCVEFEIKEMEDQTEMDMTAGTSIVNSNIDNVSVNLEITSASSDSVSNDEVEFTGHPTDKAMRHSECGQVNMEDGQTRDLSGIINFVAINRPRPLVPYEPSDEEDNNEPENLVDVDSFDGHLPSMNNAAHSLTASTSTGRYLQSRNKISSSGTVKKVRQPTLEEQSTVGSHQPENPLKVITRRLNCPQAGCPKVAKNKTRLDVHLKTKHAIEPWRCLVSKCERSFIFKSQLSDHLRHGHGKRSNWPCGLCSNSFLTHKKLHNHHYYQHEEGLFECSTDGCTFKATNRRSVVSHHYTHQTPKHTCPVANCGRSFPRQCDLNYHAPLHTQERPYGCGQCDKAFGRRETLNAHLRVHAGLMRARCTWPDCTYQSVSPSNVVMHIRSAHYKLPPTLKKQASLGIIDTRNPYDFLEKI